jgi:hypothetical protein
VIIINRHFRLHLGRRPDMSGLPYGFWFMWRPREYPLKWVPVDFDLWKGLDPRLAIDLKNEQLCFAERARRAGVVATTDSGYWREDCGRFAPIKFSWKIGLAIYPSRCLGIDFERRDRFHFWRLPGSA